MWEEAGGKKMDMKWRREKTTGSRESGLAPADLLTFQVHWYRNLPQKKRSWKSCILTAAASQRGQVQTQDQYLGAEAGL